MFCKKMYIIMAVFLAISGSILTWMLLYGDFTHNSPIRAKQVFNIGDKANITLLSGNFYCKYNTIHNVQTTCKAGLFN